MAYTTDEEGNVVPDTSTPPQNPNPFAGVNGGNPVNPAFDTLVDQTFTPQADGSRDTFGLTNLLQSLLPGGTTPSEGAAQFRENGGILGSLLPGGIRPGQAIGDAVAGTGLGNFLGGLLGLYTGGVGGAAGGFGRGVPGLNGVGQGAMQGLGDAIAGIGQGGGGSNVQPGTTDFTDYFRGLGGAGSGPNIGGGFDMTGLTGATQGTGGAAAGGGGAFGLPPELQGLIPGGGAGGGGTINIPGVGNIPLDLFLGGGSAAQGGGGGGGGGGGARGAQQGAAGAANSHLTNLFNDPNANQFNQDIQSQIESLLGLQQNRTDQFTGLAMGADNPILQAILGGGTGGGSFNGGSIGNAVGGLQAKDIQLRDLPPEVLATINQRFDADKGLLDLQRAEQNDQLTAQLFGRGVQRSTVAQDAAGRLAFGQEESLSNLMANRDDRILSSMESDAERRARLQQSELAANAQLGAARASAGASLAAAQSSARMSALRGIFGDQMGFLSNALGSNNQFLSSFANTLSGIGQAELGSQNALAGTAQNVLQSQDQLAGTRAQANASRFATSTGAQTAQQQLGLQALLGIGGLNLDQQRIDNQLLLGQQGNDLTQQQIDANTPSNTDRGIQIAAILASLYGNRGGG